MPHRSNDRRRFSAAAPHGAPNRANRRSAGCSGGGRRPPIRRVARATSLAVVALVALGSEVMAQPAEEATEPSVAPARPARPVDPPPAPAARSVPTRVTESSAAQAPRVDAPSPSEPSAPQKDPSYEINLRGGVKLPGNVVPVNWFDSQTKVAPMVGLDQGWVLARYFSLGSYVVFSPFAFDRKSGTRTIGEGSGVLLSGGLAAKGRLPISDIFVLRAGFTLGANFVSYDGKRTDGTGTFEMKGGGLQVGLATDVVYRISSRLGIVGQFGFLAQPTGTASVKGYPTGITAEGEQRKFGFKPLFGLTVGPELDF